MELTPVNVRGKRQKTGENVPSPLDRKRRRVLVQKEKNNAKKTSKKKLSFLESLPLEILVDIAIYSENIKLLYCNRHLQHMLTGDETLISLVAAAFHHTWSKALIKGLLGYEGVQYYEYLFDDNPHWQSELVRCRWVTPTHFTTAISLFVCQRNHEEVQLMNQSEPRLVSPESLLNISGSSSSDSDDNISTHIGTMNDDSHFSIVGDVFPGTHWQEIDDLLLAPDSSTTLYSTERLLEWHYQMLYPSYSKPWLRYIHPNIRIPDRFLLKPSENARLAVEWLKLLVHGGARLSTRQMNWEFAERCLENTLGITKMERWTPTFFALLGFTGVFGCFPPQRIYRWIDRMDRILLQSNEFLEERAARVIRVCLYDSLHRQVASPPPRTPGNRCERES